MTHLTRKETSLSIAMALLIAVLIAMSMSSCGPAYHLKRRDYHEQKAIDKGAKVTADTIFHNVPVFIPEIKTDTVFKAKEGDTVTIEKERLKIKYINLPADSVYIEGECKSDTVKVTVPVTVTKKISAGYTRWELIGTCIAVAAVALLIGMFIQGMKK